MAATRWQDAALMLDLQIQPGAARDEIVGLHGERLKIRITAPAVDGRANAHLIDYLATSFGTSRSAVLILRGATARSKTVRIDAPQIIPAAVAQLMAQPAGVNSPAPHKSSRRAR